MRTFGVRYTYAKSIDKSGLGSGQARAEFGVRLLEGLHLGVNLGSGLEDFSKCAKLLELLEFECGLAI